MPPQLTPDQTALMRDLAVPALKIEHETTKRVIQAIPPEKAEYRPDSLGRTAMELAWHIVASEKRFLGAMAAGGFDFSPIPRAESITTPIGVTTWFDEVFAAGLQKLQALGGDQLAKVLDFRGMFQAPAVAFIQISMNHTIHHRGQLTMYLRPMGAKVPSIYGESYDATQDRLARDGKPK